MSQKFRQDATGTSSAPCGMGRVIWWYSAGSCSGLEGPRRIPWEAGTSLGMTGRLVSAVPLSLSQRAQSPSRRCLPQGSWACYSDGLRLWQWVYKLWERAALMMWAWKLAVHRFPHKLLAKAITELAQVQGSGCNLLNGKSAEEFWPLLNNYKRWYNNANLIK